jgi:hypothetical protein
MGLEIHNAVTVKNLYYVQQCGREATMARGEFCCLIIGSETWWWWRQLIGLKRDNLQVVTYRKLPSTITCDLRLPSNSTQDLRYCGMMMRRANWWLVSEVLAQSVCLSVRYGGTVGWGIALQGGRSRVRFSMVPLEFSIVINLPTAPWHWGLLSL